MAKVLFGGGVAEIRGKLGGTIFSRNAGGAYMKNMANPTNPQTPKQLNVRALFSIIATAWQGILSAQRTAWSEMSATLPFTNSIGAVYYLSGKGLFQKTNTVLRNLGLPSISNCFVDTKVANSPEGVSIAASEGGATLTLTADDAVCPALTSAIIDGAPPSNIDQPNNNSLFKRLVALNAGNVFDTSNLITNYEAIFGPIQEGQNIELRFAFVNENNGFISPYIKASCVVAA